MLPCSGGGRCQHVAPILVLLDIQFSFSIFSNTVAPSVDQQLLSGGCGKNLKLRSKRRIILRRKRKGTCESIFWSFFEGFAVVCRHVVWLLVITFLMGLQLFAHLFVWLWNTYCACEAARVLLLRRFRNSLNFQNSLYMMTPYYTLLVIFWFERKLFLFEKMNFHTSAVFQSRICNFVS